MVRPESDRVQSITSRARKTGTKARLWVHDEWTTFDVVSVPVDALLLNVDNRRFRAERLWVEEMLGRSLDPENRPEDERCVESLLLDIAHRVANGLIEGRPSDAYESLKNDWLRRSQETPFWIRPDGTVRNGNRRLAMIQRLQREGGDSGLQWVDAVILDPGGIDEAALLEMEQREQLTENFKVRYNDIDYLLALREAAEIRDIDWFDQDSIDQVSGELQTMVEKSNREVERDLYAIKYMDLFLEDSEKPGQYHRLLRQLEVFRDIGRMMITIEANYPTDYDRVLQVLFAAVRAGKKYQDVRQIRQMFFKSRSPLRGSGRPRRRDRIRPWYGTEANAQYARPDRTRTVVRGRGRSRRASSGRKRLSEGRGRDSHRRRHRRVCCLKERRRADDPL